MGEPAEARNGAQPRGRKTARVDAPHNGERRKVTIVLSQDAAERLAITAVKERCDRSAIVERLIVGSCRDWVVQYRGPRPGPANLADGEKPTVEPMPIGESVADDGAPDASGGGEGRITPHSRLGRARKTQGDS